VLQSRLPARPQRWALATGLSNLEWF
jgi:hypothetical protein